MDASLALDRRLRTIEREVRTWRALGLCGLLAWTSAAIGAQTALTPAENMKTKTIEILDQSGKRRGWIGVDESGAFNLRAFDGNDELRAVLAINRNGANGLLLYNDAGKIGTALTRSGITFNDPAGNGRAAVFIGDTGEVSLSFRNAAGAVRTIVGETGLMHSPR